VEESIYKVSTKVLFHCSNINTDSAPSSNSVQSEKQQMRNLRFPHRNILEDQHPESRNGCLHYQHLVAGRHDIYTVIQNDCRGFNNLSHTIHLR